MKKRIFITGASSGIGRATAELLVKQGHEVWGTSRDPARLASLGKLHPLRMDLSDLDSVRAAFAQAWTESGGLDVVINNAGSGHFDPAETLPHEKIEALFGSLVFTQIELCRLALLAMQERPSGLVINVTSLASRMPVPFMAAYNAAKAAMASYTFSLQLELPDRGSRVVDLQPGDICTSFNDGIAPPPSADTRIAKAWCAVDRNFRKAPPPELVARRVLEIVESNNPPPRSTVGDLFQSRIAPLIFRFLPQRVRVWGLKMYYGI